MPDVRRTFKNTSHAMASVTSRTPVVAIALAFALLVVVQFVVACESWSDFYFSRGGLFGGQDLLLLPQHGSASLLHGVVVSISPFVMNPLGGVLRQAIRSNDRGWQAQFSRFYYGVVLRPVPVGRPRILAFALLNSTLWYLAGAVAALVCSRFRARPASPALTGDGPPHA